MGNRAASERIRRFRAFQRAQLEAKHPIMDSGIHLVGELGAPYQHEEAGANLDEAERELRRIADITVARGDLNEAKCGTE